jgi:hypothetical protein
MAATEIEQKPVTVMKPLPKQKININDFRAAEFDRIIWGITLKIGQSRDDLLRPDFYSHIAARVRKNHRFEVLHEDGNYFAELIVTSASKLGIKVAFLREIDLRDLEATVVDQSEFYPKFRGPRKWSILRTSDNSLVDENIDTESLAKQRIKDMTATAA